MEDRKIDIKNGKCEEVENFDDYMNAVKMQKKAIEE